MADVLPVSQETHKPSLLESQLRVAHEIVAGAGERLYDDVNNFGQHPVRSGIELVGTAALGVGGIFCAVEVGAAAAVAMGVEAVSTEAAAISGAGAAVTILGPSATALMNRTTHDWNVTAESRATIGDPQSHTSKEVAQAQREVRATLGADALANVETYAGLAAGTLGARLAPTRWFPANLGDENQIPSRFWQGTVTYRKPTTIDGYTVTTVDYKGIDPNGTVGKIYYNPQGLEGPNSATQIYGWFNDSHSPNRPFDEAVQKCFERPTNVDGYLATIWGKTTGGPNDGFRTYKGSDLLGRGKRAASPTTINVWGDGRYEEHYGRIPLRTGGYDVRSLYRHPEAGTTLYQNSNGLSGWGTTTDILIDRDGQIITSSTIPSDSVEGGALRRRLGLPPASQEESRLRHRLESGQ